MAFASPVKETLYDQIYLCRSRLTKRLPQTPRNLTRDARVSPCSSLGLGESLVSNPRLIGTPQAQKGGRRLDLNLAL